MEPPVLVAEAVMVIWTRRMVSRWPAEGVAGRAELAAS